RRVLFFFSSRRRHTRFSLDWSSDVCSSDLGAANLMRTWLEAFTGVPLTPIENMMGRVNNLLGNIAVLTHEQVTELLEQLDAQLQIGRASCRVRVEICVVQGTVTSSSEACSG